MRARTARRAFSLLEMVLALALGMMLLLALYLTLSMHIAHSTAGRGTLGESGVARFVATRIANDITNHLGAVDTRMPDAASSSSSSKSSSPDDMPVIDPSSIVNFNVGVRGNDTSLVLSVQRVLKTPAGQDPTQPDPVIVSDVRRVCYWLIMNGSETVGLARAEIAQATSLDVDALPTDLANQTDYVIADEVSKIKFEYFDGKAWQLEWNGTLDDGVTTVGPPAAIRITITMRKSLDKSTDDYNADGAIYTHVVALPTSNVYRAAP